MLTFRSTNIIAGILLMVLLGLQIWSTVPFYWYLILLQVYLLILFYGSYYVASQFYFPVISAGVSSHKLIAISFDDGPLPEFTPQVLSILRSKNVPAAFFCIGKRVAANPEILKSIHEEGHLIGNHSYAHSALFDLMSAEKMTADLQHMNSHTRQILGVNLRLFRPPYGVTNPNLGKAVKNGSFLAIGWNIRSLDTVSKDPERLRSRVLKRLKPGAIVLFHDTCKVTVEMLPEFIDSTRKMGYEFVRLDKLINEQPYA